MLNATFVRWSYLEARRQLHAVHCAWAHLVIGKRLMELSTKSEAMHRTSSDKRRTFIYGLAAALESSSELGVLHAAFHGWVSEAAVSKLSRCIDHSRARLQQQLAHVPSILLLKSRDEHQVRALLALWRREVLLWRLRRASRAALDEKVRRLQDVCLGDACRGVPLAFSSLLLSCCAFAYWRSLLRETDRKGAGDAMLVCLSSSGAAVDSAIAWAWGGGSLLAQRAIHTWRAATWERLEQRLALAITRRGRALDRSIELWALVEGAHLLSALLSAWRYLTLRGDIDRRSELLCRHKDTQQARVLCAWAREDIARILCSVLVLWGRYVHEHRLESALQVQAAKASAAIVAREDMRRQKRLDVFRFASTTEAHRDMSLIGHVFTNWRHCAAGQRHEQRHSIRLQRSESFWASHHMSSFCKSVLGGWAQVAESHRDDSQNCIHTWVSKKHSSSDLLRDALLTWKSFSVAAQNEAKASSSWLAHICLISWRALFLDARKNIEVAHLADEAARLTEHDARLRTRHLAEVRGLALRVSEASGASFLAIVVCSWSLVVAQAEARSAEMRAALLVNSALDLWMASDLSCFFECAFMAWQRTAQELCLARTVGQRHGELQATSVRLLERERWWLSLSDIVWAWRHDAVTTQRSRIVMLLTARADRLRAHFRDGVAATTSRARTLVAMYFLHLAHVTWRNEARASRNNVQTKQAEQEAQAHAEHMLLLESEVVQGAQRFRRSMNSLETAEHIAGMYAIHTGQLSAFKAWFEIVLELRTGKTNARHEHAIRIQARVLLEHRQVNTDFLISMFLLRQALALWTCELLRLRHQRILQRGGEASLLRMCNARVAKLLLDVIHLWGRRLLVVKYDGADLRRKRAMSALEFLACRAEVLGSTQRLLFAWCLEASNSHKRNIRASHEAVQNSAHLAHALKHEAREQEISLWREQSDRWAQSLLQRSKISIRCLVADSQHQSNVVILQRSVGCWQHWLFRGRLTAIEGQLTETALHAARLEKQGLAQEAQLERSAEDLACLRRLLADGPQAERDLRQRAEQHGELIRSLFLSLVRAVFGSAEAAWRSTGAAVPRGAITRDGFRQICARVELAQAVSGAVWELLCSQTAPQKAGLTFQDLTRRTALTSPRSDASRRCVPEPHAGPSRTGAPRRPGAASALRDSSPSVSPRE